MDVNTTFTLHCTKVESKGAYQLWINFMIKKSPNYGLKHMSIYQLDND
jgi:hypothetical protein